MKNTIDKLNKIAQDEIKFLEETYKIYTPGSVHSVLFGLVGASLAYTINNFRILIQYNINPIKFLTQDSYRSAFEICFAVLAIGVLFVASTNLLMHDRVRKKKHTYLNRDDMFISAENYTSKYVKILNLRKESAYDEILVDIDILSKRLSIISDYRIINKDRRKNYLYVGFSSFAFILMMFNLILVTSDQIRKHESNIKPPISSSPSS